MDLTGLFFVGLFVAAIYWAFKRYKRLKQREGNIKFHERDFADGLL